MKPLQVSATGAGTPVPGRRVDSLYQVHVFCCTNERPPTHRRGCCASKGSRALCDYMCRLGMTLGVRRIRINHAGCMNVCEHGPTMVIYPDAVWYKYETQADIEEIMRRHVIGGQRVERLLLDIDPATLHG